MSIEIRRRGDTTAAHANFIGADREITIDTDKKTVVVHDGKTTGGFPLARENMVNVVPQTLKKRGAVLSSDLVGTILIAPLMEIDGHLICDGSEISRTDYAALFAKIGTTFGAGDGETTFNLPDYRGYFLRGLGGNSEPDFATAQEDAIRNITGGFSQCGLVTSKDYAYGYGAMLRDKYSNYSGNGTTNGSLWVGGYGTNNYDFNASRVVPVAEENRPINKAINYFIKY